MQPTRPASSAVICTGPGCGRLPEELLNVCDREHGSPRVSPQLYDTLPLSSVRQAEQQDRFPTGELDNLINFFQSGQSRVQASRVLSANAQLIVGRAANRIFVGGTPLSYLDEPLAPVTSQQGEERLAADQQAFASSVQTLFKAVAAAASWAGSAKAFPHQPTSGS